MKQCSYCGASLDDDALFCTSCGTKFEIQQERVCPTCGARLDSDSVFCTSCGTRVDNMPTISQQSVMQQPQPITTQGVESTAVSQEYSTENEIEIDDEPKSRTNLVVIIAILAVLLCGVGGYWYYENMYMPEKIDRESPRYYTLANAVVLRSSKSSGADYNKIGSLPYGTELITYEHDGEWSKVKVNSVNAAENKQEGYVASQFLLSKPDFFLLNSIFGDQDSKENISTTKCRMAVLNYFKSRDYIGKIDDQVRIESGISTIPTADNQWQIFCKPKDVKPNNVLFKRLHNINSRFTDFAVIIKNVNSGERKLLYFYFDDDETPHFMNEQDAPEDGYIGEIVLTRYGDLEVFYTY